MNTVECFFILCPLIENAQIVNYTQPLGVQSFVGSAGLNLTRIRERIVLVAATGGGKSKAIWSIAKAFPNNTIYAIDTEDKYRGIAESEGDFPTNMKHFQVFDWDSFHTAYMSFRDKAKPGDWITVDNGADPWHWRMENFQLEKVMSKPENKKRTLEELRLTEGISDNDWGEVKRPWLNTIPYTMMRQRGINLVLAARAKPFVRSFNKQTGLETIKGKGSEMEELVELDASPDIYPSALGDASVVVYLNRSGKLYFARILKRPGWVGVEEKIAIAEPVGFWNGYCKHLAIDPKEVPCE